MTCFFLPISSVAKSKPELMVACPGLDVFAFPLQVPQTVPLPPEATGGGKGISPISAGGRCHWCTAQRPNLDLSPFDAHPRWGVRAARRQACVPAGALRLIPLWPQRSAIYS